MTLSEFVSKYNYHDSTVCNLRHNQEDSSVTLEMELPWWNQRQFKEGDREIEKKTFRFLNVTRYLSPDNIPYDQIGIFSINIVDESIVIYVNNDFTDEDFSIEISASQVIEI